MSAAAAISQSMMLQDQQQQPQFSGEGYTDNESNFESASYYLDCDNRNLAEQDMAEIDAAADDDVNEIPVWVRGEARWIAGVTEHTTAADLVEALLLDDRSLIDPTAGQSTTLDHQPPSSVLQQYVITERWRQMEQILEPKTKVLKIWRAWGQAQCEVRLRLRKIDRMANGGMMQSPVADKRGGGEPGFSCGNIDGGAQNDEEEEEEDRLFYDSGRESPTTTQGSAIVRRRRHRASKSTAAWLTQAQTVHPKSSKSTIEKLMSLILEQGETIQHQLSKLRDREVQISQLEEQKHKIREQEHGKNYLLETYLNGLHEAEEKDLTTINSDSGVNTEDTQSPNGGTSPTAALEVGEHEEGCDKAITIPSQQQKHGRKSHFAYTERENELLREHLKLKLAPQVAPATADKGPGPGKKSKRSQVTNEAEQDDDAERRTNMEDEIEVLEKIYVINKHLQREEELLVRLNAKIKRYESEKPNLGEDEILDTLNRLNSEIEQRSREIEITNREIELSDRLLNKKSVFLHELGAQLDETFGEEAALMTSDGDDLVCTQKQPIEPSELDELASSEGNCFDANPENIYNISKILLKYSDDGGGPETDRDWHHDRVNLAACHRAPINKTDTNKRIIIGNPTTTEMGPMSPPSVHHTVTTRVQIHKQPAHNHRHPAPPRSSNGPQSGGGDFIDYHSEPSGNHYLRPTHLYPSPSAAGLGCGGVDAAQANGTDFTPVDLIGMQAHDRLPPPASESSIGSGGGFALHPPPSGGGAAAVSLMGHTLAHGTQCMQVAGISDKVTAINSTRNINSTSMDTKKLATKNFILTSKAYEGLPPVAVAPPVVVLQQQQHQLPRCPQADMTQLGTLV